jgi:hypothetical protein
VSAARLELGREEVREPSSVLLGDRDERLEVFDREDVEALVIDPPFEFA